MATLSKKADSYDPLIKSKQRVRDLAEVYTPEREVKAMLDLIPNPTFEQTYLEPACGNGNFLIEILRRKLQRHPNTRSYFSTDANDKISALPRKGQAEEIIYLAIQAVSTIYGFDICPNNIAEARVRLYAYVIYGDDFLPGFLTGADDSTKQFLKMISPEHALVIAEDYQNNLFNAVHEIACTRKMTNRNSAVSPLLKNVLKRVLDKNIQQGDYLAQTDEKGAPLAVGRWSFIGQRIRREDFLLSDVGKDNAEPVHTMKTKTLSLFVKENEHD